MKKLLAGLFIFGTLFVGVQQAHASALSDALLKIQSLTKELTQLKSSLKASAADPNLPTITNIITTPSWSSLDISFKTSSPTSVTEVGYCLKKGSDSSGCVRNVVRGLSSYSDVRFGVASIEPTTNYTYYLYAKNSYGEERSADINFTSLVVPFEAYDNTPQVYLSPRVEIYPAPPGLTSNTADVGGYVTSWGTTGVSEKGACYGSSSSSATNCKTAYLVQGPGDMFATKFTGLTPDTTYYYRVYAKNSTETVYSVVSTFKTLAGASDLTPINGGWSSWSNSGGCTNNLQSQTRSCTNPAPSNGGATCGGVSTQQISCSSPVNGGWTSWTNTGGCANNLQIQTRTCTNPSPANGGAICSGNLAQQISCSTLSTLPNLTASKVDNASSYALNAAVTFNGTITNNGNLATSGTFNSHFELKSSLNSSTSVINMSPVSSSIITVGGSTKVSSSVNLTTAGNYSIRLCADQTSFSNTTGSITELNEGDNCGDWTSFVVSDNSTPSIIVTSPNNGGESIEAGQKVEIRWTTTNVVGAVVEVYVSDGINKGESVKVNNTGSVIYTLGKLLIPGSNYKAYVSLAPSGITLIDSSDNSFTIKPASGLCPTNVPSVSCPEYQTEIIKDANGCVVEFKCSSTLKSANIPATSTNVSNDVAINRTLRSGTTGNDVKKLQQFLGIDDDGIFGRGTAASVKAWQAKNGLAQDGLFGYQSRTKAGL